MWFLERLRQGQADHHVPWVMRLEGAIDGERLRAALGAVVGRHEALRTRFVTRNSICCRSSMPVPAVDLTIEAVDASDAAQRDALVMTRLEREAALPFDLTQGPLVRALLLRLGDGPAPVLMQRATA